jgi:hypothetical protein
MDTMGRLIEAFVKTLPVTTWARHRTESERDIVGVPAICVPISFLDPTSMIRRDYNILNSTTSSPIRFDNTLVWAMTKPLTLLRSYSRILPLATGIGYLEVAHPAL